MEEIKVKSGQTGLDIVNNAYASQDYISQMYTDNDTFDINEMQKDTFVYTKLNNQKINTIVNNKYTFVNGDVNVFTKLISMKVANCSFNTFLNINTIVGNDIKNLDYKYSVLNDTKIISNDVEDNFINLYNVINDVTISVGSEWCPFEDLIINNISLNGPILELSFEKMKVSTGFTLEMIEMEFLKEYSFLNNLVYVKDESNIMAINATGSLKTNEKMLTFLSALVNSPIGTESFDDAMLMLGEFDVIPSGNDWDTLVELGWHN